MSDVTRPAFASWQRATIGMVLARARSFSSMVGAEVLLLWAALQPPESRREVVALWAVTGTFTVVVLAKAIRNRTTRRMIGYYWTLPAAALLVGGVATFAAGSGRWFGTVVAVALFAAWVAHALNAKMTPAWAISLTTVAAGALAMAAADDIAETGLRYIVLPLLPLVVMPYIVGNVRMRTGLLTVVACLGLTFSGMVILGSTEGPHKPEKAAEAGPEELARAGLAREVNDITRPLLGLFDGEDVRPNLLNEPVTRPTSLVALIAIGYLILRSLRLSHERQRDTIDLRVVGADKDEEEARPEKEAAMRDLSQLQSILTAGSVVIGSERGDVGQGQRLAVALMAGIPGGQLLQAFDILTFRAPVVAEVRRLPDDAEGEQVSIVVHHPLHRRVRIARQVRARTEPFALSAIDLSGYAILAHCLSARGMPVWSEADGTGVGIAAWAEVRRLRAIRFNGGGGGPQAEIDIIETALREYDPKSLLLMLEGASRHYERHRYQASASLLTRALDDFPQFPETRLRLALSLVRIARSLQAGSTDIAEPMGSIGPPVSSSILLGFVARQRSFRRFANEDLGRKPAQDVADRIGVDPGKEPIRALEARLADLWSKGAGRSPEDQALLAAYYLHIALALLEQLRSQLVRGRLALRCLFVQSERVFFWPLLVSRYRVRRLNTAARAVEALALVCIELGEAPHDEARAATARRLLDHTLRDAFTAVERDGTGWRSTTYLAEAYSLVYEAFQGSTTLPRSVHREAEDRIILLESVARRRSLKERAIKIDLIDGAAMETINVALATAHASGTALLSAAP